MWIHVYMYIYIYIAMSVSQLLQKIMAIKINWTLMGTEFVFGIRKWIV